MPNDEDIVIVGVGCKFPGANNLQEFWRVLSNGENHVKEVPKERWNIDAFYDPDPNAPGKTYARNAGFLENINEWDHRCYGISEMESASVDPQQRLVLDCVHMALEDGGITTKSIEKTNTAVYIGSMTDDYKGQVMNEKTNASAYMVTGTHSNIISARVAYTYNLLGPAITIDTACSSSLVAIDIASQALAAGNCTTAICGGVNVLLDPHIFIALSKARMLSPSGQCQSFTAHADGYARGEGCGIVILKTFKDARKDGNKIWGTIKTGTNQDGCFAKPITAPAEEQQKALIEQLYRGACVNKCRISVIEAHGTGTAVGDPTEVRALGAHFGKSAHATIDVFIGSVKTNIGHLEAAAGVAGLIKVLLMMKNETVVPSLWYKKNNENPKLKLSDYGFLVPTNCIPWEMTNENGRMACVNSFGFGGTNAHAIVKQYIDHNDFSPATEKSPKLPHRIVTISAFDHEGLLHNAQALYDALDEVEERDLDALSYTSTCRRDHRPVRKAVHGINIDEIKGSLKNCKDSTDDVQNTNTKHIVFVYCGVGTAWNGMCISLMQLSVFRDAIEQIDIHLEPLTGWKIADKFKSDINISDDPFVSHLAIFACQVGLTELWKKFGIQPISVVGQSVGEVASAFAAGHLEMKDAVYLIYHRSKLLAVVNTGRMAVVCNIDTKLVRKHCESIGSLNVAVFTSNTSCTVSGDESSLRQLKDIIKTTGADFIDLDAKCAYHSQFVRQAANKLELKLINIQKRKGIIPMFSTVTGERETNGIFSSPGYWKDNVANPVAFARAIEGSTKGSNLTIFLEIGPSPVLKQHINRILPDNNHYRVIPSMKKQDGTKVLYDALCNLYILGFDLNWCEITPQVNKMTNVPVYQRHKHKNLQIGTNSIMRNQGIGSQSFDHLYIRYQPLNGDGAFCSVDIDEMTTPFVFEHIVNGFIIVPGATYADVGFEIGRFLLRKSFKNVCVSLEFLRPVKVEKGIKSVLQVSTITQKDNIMYHLKQAQTTMCKGWVRSLKTEDIFVRKIDIDKFKVAISRKECVTLAEEKMYDNLNYLGFQHGKSFRMMKTTLTNGVESLTDILVPVQVIDQLNTTTIHACILDAMIQTTINATTEELLGMIRKEKQSFLPVAIGEIRIQKKPEHRMFAFTRRINTTILDTSLQIHYNILLFNSDGIVIADLRNYTTSGRRNRSQAPCDFRYKLTWQPDTIPITEKFDKNAPNILVLSNTLEDAAVQEFRGIKNVTLYQPRNNETSVCIQNALSATNNHYDAVMFLVHEFMLTSDIDFNTGSELRSLIQHNCTLLSNLVKYMTEERILTPVYVVTQNTQPSFSTKSTVINLVGGELWGFVRSVQLELIHSPITLVDVRPSISQTRDTLLRVIFNTCRLIDHVKPELLIEADQVYGGQFTKDSRSNMTPPVRKEHKVSRKLSIPHKVMSSRSDGSELSCFVEDDAHLGKRRSHQIRIRVKTICSHPITVSPQTVEGFKHDQGIWEDSIKGGYQLFGIEYTGYPLTPNRLSTCRGANTQNEITYSENEWEYICIWPSKITSIMTVPKGSIVNLKDVGGQYEPGLLLFSVINWMFVDMVSHQSSVVVFSRCPTSPQVKMLVEMLKVRKNAEIIDPNTLKRKEIDILISLENIDSSFFVTKYCKEIMCFVGDIPEALLKEMARSRQKPKIISLDVISLLKTKITKILPKVVSWLRKYKHRFTTSCNNRNNTVQRENNTGICPIKEIMTERGLTIPVRHQLSYLFKKSGVYIITGGLTGLGWEITQLIAEMGAGIIALLSRRQVTSDQLTAINVLETRTNCQIICISANITKYESLKSAITEIESKVKHCNIKGVFHGAGVLNAKLLLDLEECHLEEVLNPKVIGTINMHIATREFDLDYFVVASSINSLIGSPGQSSYGAANCFMDTFIEWRRRRGLPGQAINWGALSVGMASRKEFVDNFEKRGFNLLNGLEIRSCLQEALMCNSTSVVYTDINWDVAATHYANMPRLKLPLDVLFDQAVTSVIASESDKTLSFNVVDLQGAGIEEQRLALHEVIRLCMRKIITDDTYFVQGTSTMDEIGFDSMSKVTFINAIRTTTGYQIPTKFMADTNHTYDDLMEEMYEGIFGKLTNTEKKEATNEVEVVVSEHL